VDVEAEAGVREAARRDASSARDWASMRFEGGRSGPPTVRVVSGTEGKERKEQEGRGLLRMSMSEGVTYWVPATHWKFEIVGLGGMSACGLKSLSNDFCLTHN
jgi:hypothetical protein